MGGCRGGSLWFDAGGARGRGHRAGPAGWPRRRAGNLRTSPGLTGLGVPHLKRPLHFLFFLAATVVCAQSPVPAPAAVTPGDGTQGPPAKNWVLPLFSDKEGYRVMTLRGSEAHSVGANRIDITDLNITSFSG